MKATVGESRDPVLSAQHPDPVSPLDERVEALLGRMTLDEKVRQLHGIGQMRAPGNRRLGIPAFRATDGPHGIGEAVWRFLFRHLDRATCFPVSIALAATWDPELAARVGAAIAREARAKGRNWLLAPCVNIARDPRAGRVQESFGEDPWLASRLAVAFVRAVQEQGVIATPKHLACHNQERDDGRRSVDIRVDERTLREVYLPAFKASVDEGGAWSVMTARHGVNGARCVESRYLLRELLKGEWGFRGVVVSDWETVRSTRLSAKAGLDVEMPKAVHYGRALARAVRAGEVDESTVDDAVRRVLRVKLLAGLFEPRRRRERRVVNCEAHRRLALEVARSSIVLLKNERGILPLSPELTPTLAVIGPHARVASLGDDGSSEVRPFYRVSPLRGLRERAGGRIELRHERGSGIRSPLAPRRLRAAVELARRCHAAVVCVGLDATIEGEGHDRRGNRLALPRPQVELVEAVAGVNPNTIVLIVGGGAVSMRGWLEKVPAVLAAWYPGEQGGRAIADILLGMESPSGRLPITFPESEDQLPASPEFPERPAATYREGVFVGYRHFDRRGLTPLYPFGHGLTYTEFRYAGLAIGVEGTGLRLRVSVAFDVANVGERAGTEVAQLYVRDPVATVERPEKELKRFRRLALAAGESRRVGFELGHDDLAFWDAGRRAWTAEPGLYEVLVGGSSRDIRLRGEFRIEGGALSSG
jgi:beta-glucosidase